jgi:hypothetical protein
VLALRLQNRLCTFCLLFSTLAITLPAPAAEVYRWTDENGRVVFSETVPPGVEAEKISTRVAPRTADNPSPPPAQRQQESVVREEPANAEARKPPEDPALRAANCQKARGVLNELETRPRVKALDASGEPYFITDEERAERTAAAKKSIEAWCD